MNGQLLRLRDTLEKARQEMARGIIGQSRVVDLSLVAVLTGVAIYTAMAATEGIKKQFDEAGLADLCPLAPASHIAHRGRWAAKAMPFVFGAMWVLALLGRLQD